MLRATLFTVPSGNGTLSGIVASSNSLLGDICVVLHQVGNSTAATFVTCTVTGGPISGATLGLLRRGLRRSLGGSHEPPAATGPQQVEPRSQSGATPIDRAQRERDAFWHQRRHDFSPRRQSRRAR